MDLFLIFSACFGFGLLFALISAVFAGGHDAGGHGAAGHDAGHAHAEAGLGAGDMPGFAAWSPTTMATFITAFGGIGMVLVKIEATRAWFISVPVSALGALGIALAVLAMFRSVFRRMQGSSEGRVGALAGTEATVITPVPEGGVGEIAYVQGGSRYSAAARSESGTAIAAGATVKITRVVGSQYFIAPV